MSLVFTAFDPATGAVISNMTASTLDDALLNLGPGHLLIEGFHDGETHYIAGGNVPTLRPTIPAPAQEGQLLTWETPPPGLTALVYDLWTEPPHQLAETPLSAPDCGIFFVEAGAYRLDLTADFPWLPLSVEVSS